MRREEEDVSSEASEASTDDDNNRYITAGNPQPRSALCTAAPVEDVGEGTLLQG
jgi:hypothetical protein